MSSMVAVLVAFRALTLTACVSLALGVAACGDDDDGDEGGGGATSTTQKGTPAQGKAGGKLTVLANGDVDYIDPGQTYYFFGFMVVSATQKQLFSYKPDNAEDPVPDLAEAPAEVSPDGLKVTIKIKQGVKFSPPVDREVTSADVKYAVERGFFKTVNNGYAGAYFANIKGAKTAVAAGTEIEGITTPDPQTIVFELTKPTGGVVAGALSLPLSAPVPKEYAEKFDKKNPSTYGLNQVATGPYMIQNDASGKAVGYKATRYIRLVRNPNWDESLDFKPAYFAEIEIQEGNEDLQVASRKILEGESLINGDFSPEGAALRQAVTRHKDQIKILPAGAARWIAMNSKIKPFDDVNVRKGVVAGFDREALRLAGGGELIGDIPTHILPPGLPGHEEAGGLEGPGIDFMSKPAGDPALSAEYFKQAGFASGKYEGDEPLLMVAANEGVGRKVAEVAQQQFDELGFKIRARFVTQDAMFTRFCNVPSAKVAICPSVGWFKDFSDAQTMLAPTFAGYNILPENNSNWSQLEVPEIDDAMKKAEELREPAERAKAWAEIDKMVTEQAPAVFYNWDKEPQIASANVNAVADEYLSQWSLTFSSLK